MPAPARRAPLDAAALRGALVRRGVPWRDVEVRSSTGSTNADAVALLRGGAVTGAAVVADEQTAGRGRLQRDWASPAGGSVSLSVVLRPSVATDRWGWLPLLTGLAVLEAARGLLADSPDVRGGFGGLKWPNDLVVDGPDRSGGPGPRKWGGILAERADGPGGDPAVVIGIGLNVDLAEDEVPTPSATSLALETGTLAASREELVAAVLDRLAHWFRRWERAGGDAGACGLLERYREVCVSLDRAVRVELVDRVEPGDALDVDAAGRLIVATARGRVAFSSGDVVHLRAR